MVFVPGMLVEVEESGEKGQLVTYDNKEKVWEVAILSGETAKAAEDGVRFLKPDELGQCDFFYGPMTEPDVIGWELSMCLANKGYGVMKMFFTETQVKDIQEVIRKLDEAEQFTRVASEFEYGYLGLEGMAKTLHIDPSSTEIPSYVMESPLKMMDDNFSVISNMLGPRSEDLLGFEIYSRTNMLVRVALTPEDEYMYTPADINDGDEEGYMHLMHRKKVVVLQFVGPASGELTLVPIREGMPEIQLKAEPHTVVVLLSDTYNYRYVPDGQSVALSTFLLTEPPAYTMGEISGDLEPLGMIGSGPLPPEGEQICCDALYCRYGMRSDGRQQFWMACGKAASDGLTEVPFTRWDFSPYYDANGEGFKAYTKHGCFGIDGVDLFDCRFFEISPAESKTMDPAQRQILEVSYVALLEGGYEKKKLARESLSIGHFVGIDKDDWMCMSASGMIDCSGAQGAAAAANAILANRFSYNLNLKGASMQIDTACSSSLVCTHVSKLQLRYNEFDPMPASIVNGLNLMLYPGPFIGCCSAGMLSHEGRCFTFNSTADGYARGELCGAACFKLKLLDNDSIAMLAGSHVNQDGRSASLTAPNGPAQERLLQAVLRECHLTPSEVDCFECHGTGTSLGDPIEVGSFRRVMSATTRTEPLVITSSKSNVGHGEGGAGFCGLFKCFMQVSHAEAASNVHLKSLNPHLELDGFPCQVLGEAVVMREDSAYSGVSSFGFGGTNAHGEAWGKNIMTSRASSAQDPRKAFEKKMSEAPPAEITMIGDDPLDWVTSGLDPAAEVGSEFLVRLDMDGVVTWEKIEPEIPTFFGNRFYIQGTHNGWVPELLDMHATIDGLWSGMLTLGAKGAEEFQIIADEEKEFVYCPDREKCTLKAAPISGPGEATKEFAWLVTGSPGDKFRIEWYQQGTRKAILWLRA